jgi:hypothetical protein
VEQQLADLRKEVAGLKAAIEAIAQNETIPAEVRLQAIRAALGAQGPSSQAAVPPASAEVKPASSPQQAAESKPSEQPSAAAPAQQAPAGPSTQPTPTPSSDPFAILDKAQTKDAPKVAPPVDPTAALDKAVAKAEAPKASPQGTDPLAALDKAPAAPAAAPEQKKSISIDPLAALDKVVPISSAVTEVKKAVESAANPAFESKPAPAAESPKAPAAETKPAPEAKAEVKPAAPKVEAALSPELTAKAEAIGANLSKDFGITSYDYRKITQKAELEAAKVKMDPETRKLFNEEIARTFAERTVRSHERSLADFSEHGSGFDTANAMRYNVMGRLLGGGDPEKGDAQAGGMLKVVAQERIDEILSERSGYEEGPDRVKLVEGLAKRFSVDAPAASILNEEQEIRESSLEEIKAVLGADIPREKKTELVEGIMAKANKNIGFFSENRLSEEHVAPVVAEHIIEELDQSRGEEIAKRRARLTDLNELVDTLDVEDEPTVRAALEAMKVEVASSLLEKGVPEALASGRPWTETAEELSNLRDEAVDGCGVSTEEANRVIEGKLKEHIASSRVTNLTESKELLGGIDEVASELDLSDAAVEEMKGVVRTKVTDNLHSMLGDEKINVEKVLLSDEKGRSLDSKEKEARSYIAEVADLGDDKLAHEIKVRLGAQAVETILEGDIKNKVDFADRADEAEDLIDSLGIKDEASQVIARIAEKRFSAGAESEEEIVKMKEDLYELMKESYLRPRDTKDSSSELQKDATQRLVELDKQLDTKIVALQDAAQEKARIAAEARMNKALEEINALLGNESVPIEKRISEVKKVQGKAGLSDAQVKKIVEEKVDELAQKNDRKSTAAATTLARSFGVEML